MKQYLYYVFSIQKHLINPQPLNTQKNGDSHNFPLGKVFKLKKGRGGKKIKLVATLYTPEDNINDFNSTNLAEDNLESFAATICMCLVCIYICESHRTNVFNFKPWRKAGFSNEN